MTNQSQHICVCICTYKRLPLLNRLLDNLSDLDTGGRFTYSIVVCDNDDLRSAEETVQEFAARSGVATTYCVAEQQGIAWARNKTIEHASGDFVAFIDDDEFPDKRWLLNLFDTLSAYHVDGVLGPVMRHFDTAPPRWLLKSKFYTRRVHATGTVLHEDDGRTGNVLLSMRIFEAHKQPFDPGFKSGSDTDFFKRMIEFGYRFIWSADAVVYEVVPPVRWKRSFMLKRALFRGAHVPLYGDFGWRQVAKSMIAVPIYIVMLPLTLLLGQHRFMTIMVKLCDHLGLLLALVGIRPFRQAYITE